ncbi:30S ribosomal protein S17- chloroplastic [Striga hermonthica]|uniref:30S ribosomal protein S17- chloroplastic n=1 Tax=Striga hermonthica TaxID=68872 RepID=A0A9N7MS20_STRHE|nr:30S ribosomal protein S17- chloroplastic [Striga hermonthica]
MLVASKSQVEIDQLKAQLNQEFEMKDLREAKKILGMEISKDRVRGKLCLTEKQYLNKKKKYQAHYPLNQFKVGDLVQLEKSQPISKTKTYWAVAVLLRTRPKPEGAEGEPPKELGIPLESDNLRNDENGNVVFCSLISNIMHFSC